MGWNTDNNRMRYGVQLCLQNKNCVDINFPNSAIVTDYNHFKGMTFNTIPNSSNAFAYIFYVHILCVVAIRVYD